MVSKTLGLMEGQLNDHGSNPDKKHEPPREINLSILVNMKGSR
jgi:hypothetical protein